MRVSLLDLPITVADEQIAMTEMTSILENGDRHQSQWVCFLNANNFMQALRSNECATIMKSAFAVYPDGIALRVASRLHGIRIDHNLPGTYLVPKLMTQARDNGYRCYLLGGTNDEVAAAALAVNQLFPGWQLAGFSCGYFSPHQEHDIVNGIRSSGADLLLVGMGTPEQELFVHRNASELQVPLIICVGGLFSYWNRRLKMAPRIVRRLNLEWLWILSQQPYKWRRYTIGILQFFMYIVKSKLT